MMKERETIRSDEVGQLEDVLHPADPLIQNPATEKVIACPFCNAIGFNKLGLNIHLAKDRCRGFDLHPIGGEVQQELPVDPPRQMSREHG